MLAKMTRSAPRPVFGLPAVTGAVGTSLLSCGKAKKPRISSRVWEPSGESRFRSDTRHDCRTILVKNQ